MNNNSTTHPSNTGQSKKRIPYLDLLKCFAIVCVFLGHSVEQITGNDFWDNPIWSFIYSYHMPLFMLLCGYFFGSSLKLTPRELLRKKFMQLIVPSLSAFTIMYLFVSITGFNPCPELMDFSWQGFLNAVWFLKCVFFCYLIGYASIKLLHSLPIAALLTTVLFYVIPYGNTDSVDFMLPMFWLGYFCEQQKEFIASHRKVLLVFCTVAFAVLLPFWSGRLTIYAIPIQLVDWSTGSVNWTNLVITLYRMTIGMAGSMFFFLLAPWVYEKIEHWRITPVLNHVGKSTLGLYWTQTFLLECTLHGIGIYVNTINSAWLGPCITLLELVICYQAVLLFRKSRYTRLLFLGEK